MHVSYVGLFVIYIAQHYRALWALTTCVYDIFLSRCSHILIISCRAAYFFFYTLQSCRDQLRVLDYVAACFG
jgi:hypothetical protein